MRFSDVIPLPVSAGLRGPPLAAAGRGDEARGAHLLAEREQQLWARARGHPARAHPGLAVLQGATRLS